MANTTMKKIFGKANMNVAGTTFEGRQGTLWSLRKAEKAYLTVRRDRDNEADANAVEVIAHMTFASGRKTHAKIGYIPANKAVWMAKALDSGKIVRITDYKVVGGGKASLGCELNIVHELYETEVATEAAER